MLIHKLSTGGILSPFSQIGRKLRPIGRKLRPLNHPWAYSSRVDHHSQYSEFLIALVVIESGGANSLLRGPRIIPLVVFAVNVHPI